VLKEFSRSATSIAVVIAVAAVDTDVSEANGVICPSIVFKSSAAYPMFTIDGWTSDAIVAVLGSSAKNAGEAETATTARAMKAIKNFMVDAEGCTVYCTMDVNGCDHWM